MYIFIALSIILFFVFFTLVVLGRLLPFGWQIEKAILVGATPEEIYPHINELKNWEKWSIWTKKGELGMELHYSGDDAGIGATREWKNSSLNGKTTITHSHHNKEIQLHTEIENGKFVLLGTIVLGVTDPEHTQIAWRCALKDSPNSFSPFLRFQAFFLKNYFESALAESLIGLKNLFSSGNESEETTVEDL